MVGIYKITSPSGKVYIGQSKDIRDRKSVYRRIACKGQTILFNSLNFYGFDAHKFEVVIELPKDTSKDVLSEYEIFVWLQYLEAGYTMLNVKYPGSKGGHPIGHTSGMKGKKHSEETKAKMRAANNPAWTISPETIAKRKATRLANGGYKQTPESYAKMVATRKANGSYKRTPQQIAKCTATKMLQK